MVATAKTKEAAENSRAMLQRERTRFKSISGFQGVSQDAVFRDTDRMTRIQPSVDKLQAGYRTKSIIDDLEKKGTSNVFGEASRRTNKELGFVELYALGEISKTVQCLTCLRYSKEVTSYCTCGACLVP